MNFRLKTNNSTAESLKFLQKATGLTPNVLARLAIAFSLRIEDIPEFISAESNGLEFNRNTLTGEHDYIYEALIKQHSSFNIDSSDYFPDYFNAHLSRGCQTLIQEYQLAGNYQRFLDNIISIVSDTMEAD